jgi:hypothetical protein
MLRSSLKNLQHLVQKLAKTRLDTLKSFRGQDMRKIKQICDAVSFSGCLFLKTYPR